MLHRNLALKATAFAIAVGLWFWVLMTEHNPVVNRYVNTIVRVQDIDPDLSLESPLDAVPVQVSFRCPKQDWPEAGKHIETYVSMRALGAGRHIMPIKVQAPEGVSVLSVSPSTETVLLDRLVSQVRPVEPKLEGRLPDGDELHRAEATPNRVRLTGPHGRVQRVMRVVAALDLGRVVPEIPISVPVNAVDATGARVKGLSITPEQVNIIVTTKHEVASHVVPVLVRTTGQLPAGYRITDVSVDPPLVAVIGPSSETENLQFIPTAGLALDNLTGDATRRLPLLVPTGTKLLVDPVATVTLKIAKALPVVAPAPAQGP